MKAIRPYALYKGTCVLGFFVAEVGRKEFPYG